MNVMKRNDTSGYKVLIIAIAASLAWHVFWLSAVKIAPGSALRSPAKFSRVAFLGPILAGVNMDLRASAAMRLPLEIRYRKIISDIPNHEDYFDGTVCPKCEFMDSSGQMDQKLSSAISDAIAGEKFEPDYPV